jgi:RNA polymerase sigma-70 factor, ECF subfamily
MLDPHDLHQYMPGLRAWAVQLCRNPADADDLVQDAIERCLRGAARYRPNSDLGAWLRSIAYHRFVDLRRSRASQQWAPIDDALDAVHPADPAPAWATISEAELRTAIARLPTELRVPCELRLAGHSYHHIGEVCHLTAATVGTRLLRARRQLRSDLAPPALRLS